MGPDPTITEPVDGAWQPLPRRALRLFLLRGSLLAFPFGAAALFAAAAAGSPMSWWPVFGGGVAGALFGCWRAVRSWQHTAWRLDATGFTLRRGHLWRSETRVPQSRVQHLDLQRGPLQRRFGLSTLVIHTAGTRHSAVSVGGLDAEDAERLRDVLARQVDDDDDDLDA